MEIKKQLDTLGKLKIIWVGKGYRVITHLDMHWMLFNVIWMLFNVIWMLFNVI